MVTLPTTALSSIVGMYVIVNNPLAVLLAIVLTCRPHSWSGPTAKGGGSALAGRHESVTIDERWGTGTHPRGPRR